jgi:hypothetical protein
MKPYWNPLDEVAKYWRTAFNTRAAPSERQLLSWLNRHPIDIIENALHKAAAKYQD